MKTVINDYSSTQNQGKETNRETNSLSTLSQKSETFVRQSHFSATVWTGLKIRRRGWGEGKTGKSVLSRLGADTDPSSENVEFFYENTFQIHCGIHTRLVATEVSLKRQPQRYHLTASCYIPVIWITVNFRRSLNYEVIITKVAQLGLNIRLHFIV